MPTDAPNTTKYSRLENELKQQIRTLPEGSKLATVRELMREYNVSMATVTRALRNIEQDGLISTHVGRGTFTCKTRVEAASPTTQLLGVIVPRLDDQFFGRVTKAIEKRSIESGFNIVIRHLDDQPESIHAHFNNLIKYGAAGLIYAPNPAVNRVEFDLYNTQFLSHFHSSRLAGVILDQEIDGSPFPCVCSNHSAGGEMAARHLYRLGHRTLAMIDSYPCISTEKRWQAFSAFLGERMCWHERFLFPGAGHNPTVIRAVVQKLRNHQPKITAIFAANDRIGLNILFECQRQGIAVPEELSIVGFDDLEIARMCEPSLTSIAQPLEEIGYQAVDELLSQLKKNESEPCNSIVLPVQLIERNSSSVAPE